MQKIQEIEQYLAQSEMEKINRKFEELRLERKLPLRLYKFNKKHFRKDGTVSIGPNRQWKWIKHKTIQRKYRPGGTGLHLWSKRFGYLDSYNWRERAQLRCPSGYTFGQGINKLYKVWYGYQVSKNEANIKKMEYYAKLIQDVQEDLGFKTTLFPHLGIYGEVVVFRDRKNGGYETLIDNSKREQEPEAEPVAKEEIEEQKEKLAEIESMLLAVPDVEKGEKLVTMADKPPKPKNYRIKHQNRMQYGEKRDYEWVCALCDETVPANKNHVCKPKEREGDIITISDEIPFREIPFHESS